MLPTLHAAMKDDATPEPMKLGKRVTKWIGSMVGKAVSGGWKFALVAAPQLLKDAVWHYYGWK